MVRGLTSFFACRPIAPRSLYDRTVFPQYTDHSSLHCLNITNLAGQLVGDCMKNRIWIQEHNKPFMPVIIQTMPSRRSEYHFSGMMALQSSGGLYMIDRIQNN